MPPRPRTAPPIEVHVTLTALPGGRIRIAAPSLPAVYAARTGPMFTAAVAALLREVEIAAYRARRQADANRRRQLLGARSQPVTRVSRRTGRPQRTGSVMADPAAWTVNAAGRWVAPSGLLTYGPETTTVARVRARRAALGLPDPTPEGK